MKAVDDCEGCGFPATARSECPPCLHQTHLDKESIEEEAQFFLEEAIDDAIVRLNNAYTMLRKMALDANTEVDAARLHGKAAGVSLALDHMRLLRR